MTETSRKSGTHVSRWNALLAENSILQKEHVDLLSSFVPPFSAEQRALLKASAARLGALQPKIQQLVEDWAASYRSDDSHRLRVVASKNA